MTLINVIALFEIWCADICDLFQRPDLAVKFQHPTNSTGSNGIRAGLRELQCEGSPVIADSIQMSLKKSKKYSYATLDNLLKCFRYFKEVRNCLVHRGRKCDGKLWGAQSVFLPVATTIALGMEFVPEHQIVKQSDDVHLNFHGVLGFTEVILRIAITVDAELCATPEGERILLQRIAERTSIPTKREKLFNLFTTIGWSNTHVSSDLVSYLERSGILTRNSGIPYKIDDQPQP